ncbi:MAG: putative transcriptional regulator [Marinoscillum sp.]|jgi:putative transcriptional regulator
MDYFASDHIVKPERGDLLISEPYLPDPNFERTVILLCEHDENGSFGFVLNKPSDHLLADLMSDVNELMSEVHVGGPVQQNTLHFLHRGTKSFHGDRAIADGIVWGVDFENVVTELKNRDLEEADVRFFVGYSGWSPGQLDEELKAKSWIVFKKTSTDLVFDIDPEALWKTTLNNMGGKFRLISNYPVDPRLN